MTDLKNFVEQLTNLTVRGVNELTQILKSEYGTGPATVAVAVAAGPVAGVGETTAEKTEFNVILKSAGVNRLAVVELVEDLTGFGLKEVKEVIDGAPSKVKEGASKEETEGFKESLEKTGVEVELK